MLKVHISLSLFFILIMAGIPANAELAAVSGVQAGDPPALTSVLSGGDPDQVAVSLANGFPLWYEDASGLKLELCLEQEITLPGGGTAFPCLLETPFPESPVQFPLNFGPEAFYWAAEFGGTFTSSEGGGDVLLVMAHEAAFANEAAIEGDQVVFGRIRIRLNVPVAGTYRVTHPFGAFDYVVPAELPGDREVNQTQDIGDFVVPIDFTAALADGAPPRPWCPRRSGGERGRGQRRRVQYRPLPGGG